MALNRYNIKKWWKMLRGKSILHVNQPIGKNYSTIKIKGYYNDLTEKVTKSSLKENELPQYDIPNGGKYYFSIGVFQYGLAAYDLYLQNKSDSELNRFKNAVDWAMKNQDANGGWKSFQYETKSNPYSSMAQGEGCSLLLRAYDSFKDEKYLKASKRALDFMLLSVESGGCTEYKGNEIYLKEFPEKPIVLNGWIFSIFGIYDYLLIKNQDELIKKIYNKTVNTLIQNLENFDLGYWSKYDIESKIASPFYHKLHSPLLYVLEELTGEDKFKLYAEKFERYEKNKIYKTKAFIIKALQKVREK